MGNTICNKSIQQDPTIYKKNQKGSLISTNINNAQAQKIAQIKQFLTLTSNNDSKRVSNLNIKQLEHKKNVQKSINQFKIIRGLGKGAYGQVFMVKDISQNKFYAMKIIKKDSITCSQEVISTFSQRLILEAMNHPFIVKLHYAFQSQNKLYLLCDLMSGGQLFYLLRKSKKFPQEVAKFYAAQVLLALQYLHSRNIIYRDLKPQNILLDNQGHIKITDFGLSKVCKNDQQVTFSICGTPQYIAPEILIGKGYSQTVDWFSFGSLLYDMLTGKPPFFSADKNQMMSKITHKTVPIPSQLSDAAKSLLKGLFKIKPKERLGHTKGAQQIKNHPFFANVNFEQLMMKKIQSPISFRQTLNNEGFEIDFENNSYDSTFNLDRTIKQKGLVFDGFTYYKPEISPTKKQIIEISRIQQQQSP